MYIALLSVIELKRFWRFLALRVCADAFYNLHGFGLLRRVSNFFCVSGNMLESGVGICYVNSGWSKDSKICFCTTKTRFALLPCGAIMALRPLIFCGRFWRNLIMARPKKLKEERLTKRLEIRLTATIYARLADAANDASMSLTDYARQQISNGQVIINQTRKLDHATFDQLRRLGVLLNQLTKTSNATGKISPEIVRLSKRIEKVLIQNIDDF